MNPLHAVQPYFDAWNRHEADALVASLTPDGVYADPIVPQGVSGPALVGYVHGLWAAFPDLHFELASTSVLDENQVAAQWIMFGTNTGPFNGLPPTGKSVKVLGADFIAVADGQVKHVQGYFDSGEVPRQLGLQVVVQPECVGPFEFGTSLRVATGQTTKPGEIILTALEANTPADVVYVREKSRAIAQEMLKMKGFISLAAMTIGRRMITISAWENPGDARQLMQGGTHSQASKQFYAQPVSQSSSMLWLKPERFLATAYDASSGRMLRDSAGEGVSDTGQPMPSRLAWW
jgi:steroid delta-isomerase-like uncharacterized protein